MSRRPNGQTFDLGHNEQMQLAIALSLVCDVLREWPTARPIGPSDLENLDLETLAHFDGVFGLPHGTVSITRRTTE